MDHPIIFSGPMVQALLGGRKTMTRRLAWKVPKHVAAGVECKHGYDGCPACDRPKPSPWQKVKPGDRLWVRENFYIADNGDYEWAVPACDHEAVSKHLARIDALGPSFPKATADRLRKLNPCIHMPRAFSRLTLAVAATKIEKVQAISESDAKREGCAGVLGPNPDFPDEWDPSPQEEFADLWRSLHGATSWDSNPEVVALTFTVHKTNIDQMREAA